LIQREAVIHVWVEQFTVRIWGFPVAGSHCRIRELLQSPDATGFEAFGQLEARLRDWYASTLGLPGAHYLQVVEHLFKENRLATGRFVALGRRVDLSELRCLLFLLAARDDDVVALVNMG
jgi:poly-beta-hydroxyalkanoate depolymerase